MTTPLSVHLVAQYEPLRMGLAHMIDRDPDLRVLSLSPTLTMMAGGDAFRDADVIVADVDSLDAEDAASLNARIGEWIPGMKMLFLGSEGDSQSVQPQHLPLLMSLGTLGFVQKSGSSERLGHAIKLVASGVFVCEIDVIRNILRGLTTVARTSPAQIDELSERETQVLGLVARGRSNREIASELYVAEGTVKIHVSHIMNKLDIDRRTELVRFAIAKGVAPL